jgi:polysaccharide export outer membrane protein
MKSRFSALAATCFALWVTSTASAQPTEVPTNGPTAEVRPALNMKSYVLAANDLIVVEVFQEDDLKAERRIADDGTISLPLIDRINLAGQTVDQATALIRQRLAKDYLVNPQVTVTVREPRRKRFTVLGEVQKANAYEVSAAETITLLQAIGMAGGKTGKGNLSKVMVSRPTKQGNDIFKLDVNAMSREERAGQFEIKDGDTIVVGERFF